MIEKIDIKETMNGFATVSNAEYVYGELAEGIQVKIKKSDLAEIIRINMIGATRENRGLMEQENIRSFSPTKRVYIDAGASYKVGNVNGLFLISAQYSRFEPSLYLISSKGGFIERILPSVGLQFVLQNDNGELYIKNTFGARTDFVFCYQDISR